MRIVAQTGVRPARARRAGLAHGVALSLGLLVAPGLAEAEESTIRCTVTENGAPAGGTVVVMQDRRRIASGSCSGSLSVPVGTFEVTVRLEGALDSPAQTRTVKVASGKEAQVAVSFETGMLEVRIEAKGQRGTGMVAVEKDGRRIGTLGSGVPARLSAGAYEVVVRLGGETKRYPVDLRPGQRRLVRAQF